MSIRNVLDLSLTQRPTILSQGKFDSLSTIVAAAIVDRNAVPADGTTYTLLGSGTVVVSTATLVQVIKDLAYRGRAVWMGNGVVKGSKALPTEMQDPENFGLFMQPLATGAVGETVELVLKNFYANVAGFNKLRENVLQFDVYLFTNNSCIEIRYDSHSPQFHAIGHTMAGDNTLAINGNMSITYRSETGEIAPRLGILPSSLANDVEFVLTDGTLVNMTKGTCNGKFTIFTESTTTTLSTIAFTASPAAQCITWSVFKVEGNALVATSPTTECFITSAGVFTFPSAATNGTNRYVVIAQNETGVYGEFFLQAVTI